MKHRRLTAAMAAVIMAFSGTVCCPGRNTPFCITAEAVSKLEAPVNITANVSGSTVRLKWDIVK